MCESLVSPDFSRSKAAVQTPLKLGIMASGSGSNFAAIATAISKNILPAQVQIVIYNNPKAKVAERAQQQGFPTKLINHRDYQNRESFDEEIVAALKAADVDWVIMVGWMRRATQVLIDAFLGRMVNIHPSLLPSFPGIHAIEQALDYGVKISGCTVHIVTLEVDSGPILMQAAVPVLPEDTAETLHARIQVQEHRIIVDAIAKLASNHVV
ncbi:Phosphoribosylglycinamide formyltransferase [Acaryochloris thomasi RCC1774]|uniref:Phosphoribosylglycinamide formyltransferase n=1 Tax=Acaryochloris thomasi RCC1774 TaxID=1764569 RepID=A0A2W1JWR8_9CYAN|nr:phosphoribosylglycinamide formyltransferase [Acaryochloris thomasi]PZD72827.1 Phosphoribosylglycinamide formyltransferase [Acaryochloris thomasi RCC1774]